MASVRIDQNGDCDDHLHVEQLCRPDCDDFGEAETFPRIPSESSNACDEFGEPDILPRIGDQYQVQIPPPIGGSYYISYSRNHKDAEHRTHSHHNALIGLPIPLIWISQVKNDMLESCSSTRTFSDICPKNVIKSETYSNDDNLGISNKSSHSRPRKSIGKSQNFLSIDKIRQCGGEGYLLVPGLSGENWGDADKASFLLGLYIFEKNFVEVRRFIETKEMGVILSFYYGEFYGSDEHRRWSECRKTKSKKCVYGRRMFSGLRQQELLSRILPGVSEECRNALLEVSKTFGDEKMSLADYVASLKAMIGMKVFVEAVGIGTGKQDLTGMTLEPSRSSHTIPMRPEIPTGKACSSLTTVEIIKFLSGDYRLSKARSNDLFWEAIWPRLLARGWHSEQPKYQGYNVGSKHCLVFLVPGIKKFSRRKLVKGDHYFDSVTDVLSKVAKEPGLIELDAEEDGGEKNQEECKCTSETKVEEDDNDQPTKQRHCYLQPRTPNRNSDIMKFTVVDTSLSEGKVRELRSLPSEISNMLTSLDRTEESDENTSDDSGDKSDTISTILLNASVADNINIKTKSSGKMLPGKRERVSFSFQDTSAIYPDVSLISLKKKKDLHENKEPRKGVTSVLSRKLKQGNKDNISPMLKQGNKGNISPITKRCRRSITCSREETRESVIHSLTEPRLDNGMSTCCSGIHVIPENLSTHASSCQDKLSTTNSLKGSPTESIECNPNVAIHATEFSLGNSQTQTLIDLNLPQVSPEFENGIFTTELSKEHDNETYKLDGQCLPKSSPIEARFEQQSMANPRRHSTRNRPPTTKALEALANGYLTVNRRRKNKDTSLLEDLSSRPFQRARSVVDPNESTNSFVPSQIEETEKGVFNGGNCNMFGNFQVLPEANGDSF